MKNNNDSNYIASYWARKDNKFSFTGHINYLTVRSTDHLNY